MKRFIIVTLLLLTLTSCTSQKSKLEIIMDEKGLDNYLISETEFDVIYGVLYKYKYTHNFPANDFIYNSSNYIESTINTYLDTVEDFNLYKDNIDLSEINSKKDAYFNRPDYINTWINYILDNQSDNQIVEMDDIELVLYKIDEYAYILENTNDQSTSLLIDTETFTITTKNNIEIGSEQVIIDILEGKIADPEDICLNISDEQVIYIYDGNTQTIINIYDYELDKQITFNSHLLLYNTHVFGITDFSTNISLEITPFSGTLEELFEHVSVSDNVLSVNANPNYMEFIHEIKDIFEHIDTTIFD